MMLHRLCFGTVLGIAFSSTATAALMKLEVTYSNGGNPTEADVITAAGGTVSLCGANPACAPARATVSCPTAARGATTRRAVMPSAQRIHSAATLSGTASAPAQGLCDLSCTWDCGDGDGQVGINDFLTLLGQWDGPGSCDFDGGGVGIVDFLALLANWGPCP